MAKRSTEQRSSDQRTRSSGRRGAKQSSSDQRARSPGRRSTKQPSSAPRTRSPGRGKTTQQSSDQRTASPGGRSTKQRSAGPRTPKPGRGGKDLRGRGEPGAERGAKRRGAGRGKDAGKRSVGNPRKARSRSAPDPDKSIASASGQGQERRSAPQTIPRWLREALTRSGIEPRHALGQHFLHDQQLLERQLAYAELDGSQTVLEIGAGVGQLTERLAARSARLIAIEKDRRFAPLLDELAARVSHLQLIWGDALQVRLPAVNTIVANLPFGPALPLTFRLLEHRFDRAVLMYQRRLAGRLCARVGEPHYGRLSVAVGRIAEVELLEMVPPSAFHPQPEVESALVLVRRVRPRFDVPDEPFFRSLLEALFAQREDPVDQVVAGWAVDAGKAGSGREPRAGDGQAVPGGMHRSHAGPPAQGSTRRAHGGSPAQRGSHDAHGGSPGPGSSRRTRYGQAAPGEARRTKAARGFPATGAFTQQQAHDALSGLPGKARQKPVFRLTPKEFGVLAWALWRSDPARSS